MVQPVIEPTNVWTREEWFAMRPWREMPDSDLRREFKAEAFQHFNEENPWKM